jgi:hypothetical protein
MSKKKHVTWKNGAPGPLLVLFLGKNPGGHGPFLWSQLLAKRPAKRYPGYPQCSNDRLHFSYPLVMTHTAMENPL